jgi:hypothetical protein
MLNYRQRAARDLCQIESQAAEGHAAFCAVAGFFDYIGTLLRLGYVDEELVYSSFSLLTAAYWTLGAEIVAERRAAVSKGLWKDFECLVGDMQARRGSPLSVESCKNVLSRELHALA